MLRRSHSSIQSFDIQLYGNSGRDDNIILLSGAPLEASASPLTGQLVLNLLDTTTIKKITIKLQGYLKLRWGEANSSRSGGNLPERFSKQLYGQEYSGFEIPGKLVNSNPGSVRATPVGSLSNLASYFGGGHKHKSSNSNSLSREASPISSRAASVLNLKDLGSNHSSSTGSINNPGPSSSNGSHGSSNSGNGNSGNGAHQVPAGTHTFPFELTIPGDINESIEGNKYAQVYYRLVAVVERGSYQHDLTAKRHVRIVRTVGVDSYDIAHTVTIENTWPNKIEYKITVPCKAAPIGSQLEVQFTMFPLNKGLRLGRIRAEIVEYVTLTATASQTREEQHVVAQQFFEVPENFDHFSDQWELMKLVDVPRSLSRCTQDAVVQPYTKIAHKFRCFISLINQDGHTSELRASLPITLYISPNIYVVGTADENAVTTSKSKHPQPQQEQPIFNVERTPRSGQITPSGILGSDDGAAPPTYSHHVYDRLFSTVATPAESPQHSGTTTPRPGSPHNSGAASLNNLDAHQQAQLVAGLRALASRQNSSQRVPTLSRNNSNINLADLSRVPSYDEAIHESAPKETAPEYPEE